MTQYALPVIDPLVTTGTELATYLNSWAPALLSSHKGPARPAYAVPGMIWVREDAGPLWPVMVYTGTGDVQVGIVNPTLGTFVIAGVVEPLDPKALLNFSLTAAVAASALTLRVKVRAGTDATPTDAVRVSQRNSNLAAGDFNFRTVTAALSLVVSNGSTLGHVAGRLSPIYVYLIDNAGAQELAVSGTYWGESGIFTTSAEGGAGAADAGNVMYSAVARVNMPGRLVAILWSNQAVAGVWATNPTEIKLAPFDLDLVGALVDYMGAVPYGYLPCDGANVSRTTYAKLFGKVGITFGAGDGSTTFGVPDLRRRTTIGVGGTVVAGAGNALGNVGGTETHALIAAENGPHSHSLEARTGSNDAVGGASVTWTGFTTGNTSSAGSGTGHNNMPPAMAVTKMIRWLGDV
jgi:microcystin-dependent protein